MLGPDDLDDDKRLRLDAFKLVLAGIAGYGAAVTVWLALRRQQHFERHSWSQRELDSEKQAAEARDNQARRALELYSAATDQLASEQAGVRLAGIYAFERLASEDETYRQTVVDVYCAYLRMPRTFVKTSDKLADQEVRGAIQSVLMRHLPTLDSADGCWSGVRMDLRGALLTDFDASRVRLREVDFSGAQFSGSTNFYQAAFDDDARFEGAQFSGSTVFRKARFEARVNFSRARFTGEDVAFVGARFQGPSTFFTGCSFSAKMNLFRGARFVSPSSTNFSKSDFSGRTTFKRATFASRTTSFNRTRFVDIPRDFSMARFTGEHLLVDDEVQWSEALAEAKVAIKPTVLNNDQQAQLEAQLEEGPTGVGDRP